jgi:hypothetical protein
MARGTGPKLVASVIALTLAGIAAMTAAPAIAGGNGPAAGHLYRSGPGSDPSVRLLAVGERPDGRPLVVVAATFECEELELEGVVLAPVKGDGRFRVETGGFALTGGGTDEVDAEIVLRGEFRGTGVKGSIAADAEAFDNAGTTGTCDDEVDWDAKAGTPNAALERIRATVALTPGPAVVAASPDAAYVVTTPDEPAETRLHRVHTATNEVAWEVETGVEIAALAATAATVWAVDAEPTRLVRFDAITGEEGAEVPLDAAVGDDGIPITPAVVADDTAVWVAAGDLFRIDPVTNAIVATIDLGEGLGDTVLALGAGAVYVAIDASSPDDVSRLVRVDPATNTVVTEVEGAGDLVALAPTDDALWAAPFFEDVRRLDPTTLDDVGTVDVEAFALASAAPGAWMLTERGVAAYDAAASDDPAVRIPLLGGDFGTLAANGDTVWVWDAHLGTLTRVEAG